MHITFVKKIHADGRPCPKCEDVERRLREGGHWHRVDAVVVADDREPESEGMGLARELKVERAPFFIVRDGPDVRVYTIFFRFLREVLDGTGSTTDEARDILAANPDLDLV